MSKEAMKLALEALEGALSDDKPYIEKSKQAVTALREALAEQPVVKQDLTPEQPAQQDSTCNKTLREQGKRYPRTCKKCGLGPCIADRVQPAQQQEQKLEFVSPGGGYVPAIPRPIPLDWKLVPRKATPEMLRAMDECAQEGYDERLYEGMASSVYMAAWDASPVLGTLPPSEKERSMMDIIVGNLVREGINKHRARELAEHFIKQCNYTNGYCTGRIDLLAEQKAQQRINCKSKRDSNGVCPHHNLQCGWPKCNESEQPAQQQEPVAWAETAMRLAADLSIESLRLGSYERKDTYENAGRASWQTIEIREKREAARERLRQHVYTSTQAQLAQQQEPVVWNVIDPFGKIVATEKDAIRGWARIQGYKPTVESLLGFQEQGWRVVPASPPPAQRTWVGLTSDEIAALKTLHGANRERTAIEMAFAVQAKLKEKNT